MTEEVPIKTLNNYLPSGSYGLVLQYLNRYRVQLTLTQSRKTILGDYRRPHRGKGHRISINSDLNPYAFLLTLLHELAHLLAFENHGTGISPHGREWKQAFRFLLKELKQVIVLPEDLSSAIAHYMKNPKAQSCTDAVLTRTLKKYDPPKKGVFLVEELKEGDLFATADGVFYQRGKKLRKRYKCKRLDTGNWYSFSPFYEARRVKEE